MPDQYEPPAMPEDIEQVDPVLSEDGRTILFYGWTASGEDMIASLEFPIKIDEAAFIQDQWRGVENLHWRKL